MPKTAQQLGITEKAKHTPEPWVARDTNVFAYTPGCGTWIANTSVALRAASVPEQIANARLIAAAPDMLKALKDVTRILEAVRYTAGIGNKQIERIEKARAVLDKATGAQS